MGIKKEIEGLSKGLKPLTEKQIQFVNSQSLKDTEEYVLSSQDRRARRHDVFFSLFDTKGDWQIERVFRTTNYIRDRGRRVETNNVVECFQWFLNVKTLEVRYMKLPFKFMRWGDFDENKQLHYSKTNQRNYYYSDPYVEGEYKITGSHINKVFRQRGLTAYRSSVLFNNREVMFSLLQEGTSSAEVILKSVNWKCAGYYFTANHMTALKVMNRHKIVICRNDVNDFRDAITLMAECGKDIHSPVLLKDWRHQHDLCLKIKERRKKELEIQNAMRQEEKFKKHHEKYLYMSFSEDGLNFRTLNSVTEYLEEGEAMHHCVYKCGYYNKNETLIFSIRDDENKRLATLEYNMKLKKVMQCRACCNRVPERYDDMLKYFNKHIEKEIKERNKQEQLKSA